MRETFILQPTNESRLFAALHEVSAPMPSTKGMNPKDRANRLHAELLRRIGIAARALHPTIDPHPAEASNDTRG